MWFNKYHEIKGTAINFPKFSNEDFSFLLQLFENGKVISWANLKDRYDWQMACFFSGLNWNMQFLQDGKKLIFDHSDINENDLYQNHHIIKARILSLNKISSKEIYSILISNTVNEPTLNNYFEKLFENKIGVKFTCHYA